jgi:methionine salvage enolase-phosphatase E1
MTTANHCLYCLCLDQDGELMLRVFVIGLIPRQWCPTNVRLWISSTGGVGAQMLLVRFRLSQALFRLSLV